MIIKLKTTITINTDLVFSEGVYQCTVNTVDGKAESQNDDIFGHGYTWRIAMFQTARRIEGIR